ncbi:MAG: tetratricopeptide repeat protein [Candidatus Poribacteria bacterium]|mgnify:CR=1 FL=1
MKTRNDTTNTSIDLGDDLIEKTAFVSKQTGRSTDLLQSGELLSKEQIESFLQSARILINEGLSEEAKKIFHRILMVDEGNVSARRGLDEIHELELKQIFGGDNDGEKKLSYGLISESEVNDIIKKLDDDFKLGLFSEFSLLGGAQGLKALADKLSEGSSSLSVQDCVDIGIAYCEMELYGIAARQFAAACDKTDEPVSVTALLAYALIMGDKPFEAVTVIQPLLNDSEIEEKSKIELYYLLGRAYERMGKFDIADEWYRQVIRLDPHYRDMELKELRLQQRK